MSTAGTTDKRWRQKLGRALLLGVITYVLVAATAGTISFITPLLPKPAPWVKVEDFARLLREDLRRGGVVEYCPPFHCFDRDRGYQGFRILAN
jgi:hypothetical protein